MDDNRVRVISTIKGRVGTISKLSKSTRLEIFKKLLLIPADLKVAVYWIPRRRPNIRAMGLKYR